MIRRGLHNRVPSWIPLGLSSFAQLILFFGARICGQAQSGTDQRIESNLFSNMSWMKIFHDPYPPVIKHGKVKSSTNRHLNGKICINGRSHLQLLKRDDTIKGGGRVPRKLTGPFLCWLPVTRKRKKPRKKRRSEGWDHRNRKNSEFTSPKFWLSHLFFWGTLRVVF